MQSADGLVVRVEFGNAMESLLKQGIGVQVERSGHVLRCDGEWPALCHADGSYCGARSNLLAATGNLYRTEDKLPQCDHGDDLLFYRAVPGCPAIMVDRFDFIKPASLSTIGAKTVGMGTTRILDQVGRFAYSDRENVGTQIMWSIVQEAVESIDAETAALLTEVAALKAKLATAGLE